MPHVLRDDDRPERPADVDGNKRPDVGTDGDKFGVTQYVAIQAKWAVVLAAVMAALVVALIALCCWLWWRLDALENETQRPSWTKPEVN